MDHEELQNLCAGHALGILDPPESARLEAHLRRGCDSCEEEIAAYVRSVGSLGALEKPIPPPADAGRALRERLAPRHPAADPRSGGRPAESAGTISALVARWLLPVAAILVAGVSLWSAADARGRISNLVLENLTLHRMVDRMTRVQAVEMDYVGGFRAHALLLLDPGETDSPNDDLCSLHVGDLPAPPEGRIYQAWVVSDGALHDLGTFRPDESGFSFTSFQMIAVEHVNLVQVTVEPSGGARTPTGPAVLRVRRGPS